MGKEKISCRTDNFRSSLSDRKQAVLFYVICTKANRGRWAVPLHMNNVGIVQGGLPPFQRFPCFSLTSHMP